MTCNVNRQECNALATSVHYLRVLWGALGNAAKQGISDSREVVNGGPSNFVLRRCYAEKPGRLVHKRTSRPFLFADSWVRWVRLWWHGPGSPIFFGNPVCCAIHSMAKGRAFPGRHRTDTQWGRRSLRGTCTTAATAVSRLAGAMNQFRLAGGHGRMDASDGCLPRPRP